MSYRESYQELFFPEDFTLLYPEVRVHANYDLDGEVQSIDVMIDNLRDELHCEEFAMNDVNVPHNTEKRFEALRRRAKRELTPGIYNADGNKIRKPT
jgi:hypothetical protein